jgi:hypothetical protein
MATGPKVMSQLSLKHLDSAPLLMLAAPRSASCLLSSSLPLRFLWCFFLFARSVLASGLSGFLAFHGPHGLQC